MRLLAVLSGAMFLLFCHVFVCDALVAPLMPMKTFQVLPSSSSSSASGDDLVVPLKKELEEPVGAFSSKSSTESSVSLVPLVAAASSSSESASEEEPAMTPLVVSEQQQKPVTMVALEAATTQEAASSEEAPQEQMMVPLEETGAFQGSALLDQTETPEQQKLELDNFKSLFDSAVQALTEAQDEAEAEAQAQEAEAEEAEAAAAEAEVEAETAACEEARQTCDVTTCANSRAVVNECIATESGFKTECRCENGATASSWRESSSSVGGLLNSFFPTFDSIFRDDSFFRPMMVPRTMEWPRPRPLPMAVDLRANLGRRQPPMIRADVSFVPTKSGTWCVVCMQKMQRDEMTNELMEVGGPQAVAFKVDDKPMVQERPQEERPQTAEMMEVSTMDLDREAAMIDSAKKMAIEGEMDQEHDHTKCAAAGLVILLILALGASSCCCCMCGPRRCPYRAVESDGVVHEEEEYVPLMAMEHEPVISQKVAAAAPAYVLVAEPDMAPPRKM